MVARCGKRVPATVMLQRSAMNSRAFLCASGQRASLRRTEFLVLRAECVERRARARILVRPRGIDPVDFPALARVRTRTKCFVLRALLSDIGHLPALLC